jgi:hypothetical protein
LEIQLPSRGLRSHFPVAVGDLFNREGVRIPLLVVGREPIKKNEASIPLTVVIVGDLLTNNRLSLEIY